MKRYEVYAGYLFEQRAEPLDPGWQKVVDESEALAAVKQAKKDERERECFCDDAAFFGRYQYCANCGGRMPALDQIEAAEGGED